MDREKAKEKLKKIKALAERGVGGEKESAMKMYRELLEKYELQEDEDCDAVNFRTFRFKTEIERELLKQIFYKVTGSNISYKIPRSKKQGVYCTDAEELEIDLLFAFYKNEIKEELDTFLLAFFSKNRLSPDKTARCYKEPDDEKEEERDDEKIRKYKKAAFWAMGMEGKTPPRALLETKTI